MRLLIIRFSSFGDIVQAIAVPQAFLDAFPGAQVDWLTREDFADLLRQQPSITNVVSYSRRAGFLGLVGLAWRLSRHGYTHIYDAHSNLRSWIVRTTLRFGMIRNVLFLTDRPVALFAVRPKDRLARFWFFKFRKPSPFSEPLPRPFRGADSYHRPLLKWGLPARVPTGVQFHLKEIDLPNYVVSDLLKLRESYDHVVAVAASAAWEMKRWPTEHWRDLILRLPRTAFVLLGGPNDQFLEEIRALDPERVLNLAGKLTLDQSSAILTQSDLVIANDTGVLHVADQMERPTIALIGPTAFGYPSHETSVYLERPLACQPCSKDGRGGCVNTLYKRCLVELTPEIVSQTATRLLSAIPVRSSR